VATRDPNLPNGARRGRLLRHTILFAVPILVFLTLGLLQYSGRIRLEELFDPDHPERVDPAMIYWGLGVPALILLVFRGLPLTLAWLRRGKETPPRQTEPKA
jgi:hypothetical protein